MAVDADYYAVLSVARHADKSVIEDAVKKAMREWRKRTEAPELSVRQEAELKVKQIESARTTLLDDAKRAAYDRELAGGVKEPAQANTSGTAAGQTWLEKAEDYLSVGDYNSAAYAAREATQNEGANARTWWIRSRANAGLGIWQDALYEAKQAAALEENNADYHFNLGIVHEQMSAYNDAINSYRRAGTCDPNNPIYELSVGGVFVTVGKPDQALPIIEGVYKKFPQDPNANYYLGSTLVDLAERVPAVHDGDTYTVTSADEINRMRQYAERAMSLNVVDSEVRDNAGNVLRYLELVEKKTFRPPWRIASGIASAGMETGFAGGCAGIALGGIVFLFPLVFLVIAISCFGSHSAAAGVVFLLLTAGACWLWWYISWIPRWKANRRVAK